MNIKDELKKLFNFSKQYYSKSELQKKLKIQGEKGLYELEAALSELVEEGYIFFDSKKGYRIFSNDLGMAYGIIEINKNGNGFVHTKDGYIIFISLSDLNGALNGDAVIVYGISNGRKNEFVGKIKQVVKRKKGTAFFRVDVVDDEIFLIPYNNNYNIDIVLDKNDLRKLVKGDIIKVSISINESGDAYSAHLEKVLGNVDDENIDLKVLAESFSISTSFSDEELKEAELLPDKVREEDKIGRRDLTHLDFVTIDCDNTKDRDDAVFVEKLPNGNYRLYVSIASVNHYVKRGSALYEGIKTRCTSHYPNDMVFPMLPPKISNGICSLNEGEERLTKTCEMEIDSLGNVVNYDIYNSVIRSRKGMKYGEVNRIINGESLDDYAEFVELINLMQELNIILESAKENREYLEFNIPNIEVSKENNEFAFSLREQKDAEKLIENFMVTTNAVIASHYSWMPFIYRIHESPSEAIIKSVIQKMNLCGFSVKLDGRITRGSINALLKKFTTKEECQIFHKMLLKSMAKAKYSTSNVGHYALKLDFYTHFTSPIRRVSDFMIHTAIDELAEHHYDAAYAEALEAELAEISVAASREEVNDFNFEEEARKMAMAEYMEGHIGGYYEGMITELYPNGIFVRTNGLIEGKVSLNDIGNAEDRYHYDSDHYVVLSKRTKQAYHVGDKVLVKTIAASKCNRTINFRLEKNLK